MRIFLNRLICLTALIGNCLAVLDLAAVIRDTPSCAVSHSFLWSRLRAYQKQTVCTVQILGQSNCPVTEITSCVCNNTALQKTLAQCILKSCDIPDQRSTSTGYPLRSTKLIRVRRGIDHFPRYCMRGNWPGVALARDKKYSDHPSRDYIPNHDPTIRISILHCSQIMVGWLVHISYHGQSWTSPLHCFIVDWSIL